MRTEGQLLPGIQWMDAVAAPVFLLEKGAIQYANPAAVALAGLDFASLKGSDMRQLLRMDEATLGEIGPLLLGHQESGELMAGIESLSGGEIPIRLVFKRVPAPEAQKVDVRQFTPGKPAFTPGKPASTPGKPAPAGGKLAPAAGKPAPALVMLTITVVGDANRPLNEVVELWRDLKEHDLLMAENLGQKDLLHKIFDVDPGGLAVISGPDLIIRMANPSYRAALPDPSINPVGRMYTDIWSGCPQEAVTDLLRRVIKGDEDGLSVQSYVLGPPDAPERYFSMRTHPLQWEGEAGVLVVTWETTALEMAQRTAEELAAEGQRRASELSLVIDTLPDGVLILDAAGAILRVNPAARSMLGFDPVNMHMADLIKNANIVDLDGEVYKLNKMPFMRALQGHVARGERLVLSGREIGDLHVLASSSPLYQNDQLVGAVSVWRDITELSQRRMELEAVVKVASALRNAIVQDEMFPIILEQVLSLLRMQGASLLMLDPTNHEIVVRLGIGLWAQTTGMRMPPGEGITAQVLSTGVHYLNNDIQADPRLVRAIFTNDLTCGACVPLSSHGMVIGAIWMGRSQPIHEEDVALLSAIADIASSNLYRARLFEQTQLRFQRLSALHSIDMAITSSLDLNLTLSVLLDQVVSQMRVDAADILLFDQAMHWLDYASGRGFLQPQSRMEPHRLSESPAGQVAMERRMVSIPDLDKTEIPKDAWLDRSENFRAYFAAPLIAKGQVKGVLELFLREARQPDAEWLEFLETLATQAAIAIDGAELFERLQRSNEELMVAYDATIEGWSRALELRDHETHGHAQRVTELTIRLARRIGVREEDIPHYRRGVLLHDIGKMAVPDSILLKEGPLTPAEQEVMRRHPVYAYELLYPIAYLRPALDIPYSHHEWWDGTGYPRGLKGEEIPLSARIFAVVDVWDALCSDRNYRPAWPVHKVIEHIRSMSGAHFDPRVVEEFLKMVQSADRFRYTRF